MGQTGLSKSSSFKLFAEKVMPVVHNDPAFMLLGDQRRHAEANANK